jgi:myo-inositol-1(or 4)-monophosphatase
MNMSEIEEYKRFTRVLSDKSGEIIKQYFRKDILIESKSDDSPVTIADKKTEEVMREMILKEFPEHGILGEEFGKHNPDAEYQWILDPIDGTKSFICGTVTFGTLIALTKGGEPVLGVINQPILEEYLVGDNLTAELNGKRVQMRECNDLKSAVLLASDHLVVGQYQNGEKFDEFIRKVKLYRNWGDCYAYYLLATGFADIMVDPIMSTWDLMALIPVIKGADGIITDYQGKDPVNGNSIIAASPGIHSTVIKELN